MPLIEGKGYIKPAPVRVCLTTDEVKFTKQFARWVADSKGYSLDNCFLGFLGQGALGKHILIKLGEQYRADFKFIESGGDGGIDIDWYGEKIQIKTHYFGSKCQVQRTSKERRLIPLSCDLYFFCQQVLTEKDYCIDLLGWVSRAELENPDYSKPTGFVSGRGSFLQIEERYLKSTEQFIKELKNIRNLALLV